ncbi:hypothetical protein IW492_17655 [Enterococcus sp. BWB1-3]|uniref:hypothetical protein n=1 Tax=unclassified Enterococcus TaxID=2608891 RepID=UPI001923AE45|nr:MULTISPECIES: hypothetical protein [unclassified Enterococcus]MBL1231052.1 hypothetical protein [Enterococcus sp. BWB1-3]MCB5950940.1 hypothetical protein [Enterococcus sp. BWT-B8]
MQNVKELSTVEMQQTIGGGQWSKGKYLNTCVAGAYGAAITGTVKNWKLGPFALVGGLGAEISHMSKNGCFNRNGG